MAAVMKAHAFFTLVGALLVSRGGSSSDFVEVPIDSVRSAKQLADLLPDPPPAQAAPAGLSWEQYSGAINVSCEILFPLEGSQVLPQFEVMLQVLAEPLGALQSTYHGAFHCVEIDGTTPACWPLLDLDLLPRFAGLQPGVHTVRAAVTNAVGDAIDPSTWSATRTFVVTATPPTADGTPREDDGDKDGDAPASQPDDDVVVLDAPQLKVARPPEMSVLTTSLFDLEYNVVVAEPDLFEQYFNVSYACGAIDGRPVHACWPVFGVEYKPRWMNVPDGVHTVQMVVTHPNSAEEIAASWSAVRAFVVLADNGGALLDTDGGWSGHADPNTVLLDIQVGAVRHPLPVQRSADYRLVARLFCASRMVGNDDCEGAIVREITAEFQTKDKQLRRSSAAPAIPPVPPPPTPPPPPPEVAGLDIPTVSSAAVATAMTEAVATCRQEQQAQGLGLDCLTAQSELFGMRTLLASPSEQEALMEFIGNIGAVFGF